MNYLFLTNTPAHVHLYKHAVKALEARGHEVLVLGRDYGVTKQLLEYHDLPYRLYGRLETNKWSLLRQLPRHYLSIFRQTRRYDPDRIFGMGAYAAHAGALSRTPVTLILDSEPTSLDHAISRPFAETILTPHAFGKDLGANHYRFRGFKECAYLHPDVFEPREDIRAQLGVGDDEKYVICRFNAFGSHHDVNHSGIGPGERRELTERLAEHATVFVSDESGRMNFDSVEAKPFDLHPGLLHDALSEAHLLVADTQTMVTEAALLGTPAIRSNSFVGESDMGNFIELEREELIYNIESFDTAIGRACSLLDDDSLTEEWTRKRDAYMADKVNLTAVIVDLATNAGGPEAVSGLSRGEVPSHRDRDALTPERP
jgi:predicted glycosyltransferase